MSTNEQLWQDAVSFAARKHRHDLRKDGITPYAAHPMRVCLTVSEIFGCHDAVVLAAAMLHDTIEDTTTDYDEVLEAFGVEVAEIVAAMTKNMAMPEKPREVEYDRQLAAASWRARLIKLGDVYDNITDSNDRYGASTKKAIEKARRAISLARGDVAAHPESQRAVDALTALIDKHERATS